MLDGSNSRNPLSDAIRGNLQICYAASASATTKQPIISNLMLFVSETIEAAKLVGTCKLVCGTNIMHSYRLWLESLETRLIETVQIFARQCKSHAAGNHQRAHCSHVNLGPPTSSKLPQIAPGISELKSHCKRQMFHIEVRAILRASALLGLLANTVDLSNLQQKARRIKLSLLYPICIYSS